MLGADRRGAAEVLAGRDAEIARQSAELERVSAALAGPAADGVRGFVGAVAAGAAGTSG